MKILCCLLMLLFIPNHVYAEELASHASSAYLMEENGLVLYEKNSEEKLYPASMTKMMGLILIYEALNSNSIKLTDYVKISSNAASMGGSQIYLEENEQMSVYDLLKAICISSANDAMVAMAEYIHGSVSVFVDKMNEKGKELKLVNTNFVNTTGLHDDDHYSCAKDMALIAQKLLQVGKDDLLEITSTYDAYVREDTDNPFWLVNTNKLVKFHDHIDGLKTGFTQEAKSCITVTSTKNNIRLIGVVMKEPDSQTRNSEVLEMINYGYSQVELQSFYKQNEIYAKTNFEYGLPHEANLIYLSDVDIVKMKDEDVQIEKMEYVSIKDTYPIETNEKVGELMITFSNNKHKVIEIGVDTSIAQMSFMDYFFMVFGRILT